MSRSSSARADLLSGRGARAFWTLVGVRVAFWLGTALTLLWDRSPVAAPDRDLTLPRFQAYGGHSDLLFNTFTLWDSGWFLDIAESGYRGEQSAAFFPLYPLLVHALAWVTRSPVVAGVLISLVAAGFAAVGVQRIAEELLPERAARDSVLYLALWPIAFVFTSVYSEGLFLAFAVWCFWAAMQRRPWLAAVLGALAVETRLIGLALIPALVVLLWPRERHVLRLAPLLLLPAALGVYAWYLEHRLGNWRAFYEAQGVFWLHHRPAAGPLGGLWEAIAQGYHGVAEVLLHLGRASQVTAADEIGTRNALHLVLLVAAIWLTWVAWRRLGTAAGVYSVAYLAILLSAPVSYFPLVSLPRYLLGDFPLFLALASFTERRPTARQAVLIGFAAVGAAAAIAFSRDVWVA
jgi:putative Ca2+/H+ antiporter (TMEM165/GDT1 family)